MSLSLSDEDEVRVLLEEDYRDLSFLPPIMGQEPPPNLENLEAVSVASLETSANQEMTLEDRSFEEETHEEVGLLTIEDDIQQDMIQEIPPEYLPIEEMIRADEARKLITLVPTPINVDAPLQCIFQTRLTRSHLDRNHLNLPKKSVDLFKEFVPQADLKTPVEVDMFDKDKGLMFPMRFTKYGDRHVLTLNWLEQFVRRRNLEVGDEIVIHWDNSTKRLQFSVQSRRPGNITP